LLNTNNLPHKPVKNRGGVKGGEMEEIKDKYCPTEIMYKLGLQKTTHVAGKKNFD